MRRTPEPPGLTPFEHGLIAATRALYRIGATDVTHQWDSRIGGWRMSATLDGQTRSVCSPNPDAGLAILEAGAALLRTFLLTSKRAA